MSSRTTVLHQVSIRSQSQLRNDKYTMILDYFSPATIFIRKIPTVCKLSSQTSDLLKVGNLTFCSRFASDTVLNRGTALEASNAKPHYS